MKGNHPSVLEEKYEKKKGMQSLLTSGKSMVHDYL